MSNDKTIIIIPARGGSKGIPRKNLRPINGNPLIYYSIKASLEAQFVDKVIVSTEDEEIKLFSNRFGAEVVMRPDHLAMDSVPIDPVVEHAVDFLENKYQEQYKFVVTVQPTSPLISSQDIDSIIQKLKTNDFDTIISACEDKHLRWKVENNLIVPEYKNRVNRQLLPDTFKETGAIIACHRNVLRTNTRIGKKIGLYAIDPIKSIDIDSYNDLWLCELILKRKRVVIAVIGSATIGMGHAFRTLMLAHELIHHEIIFVCKKNDDLAIEYITKHNYRVEVTEPEEFEEKILMLKPELIINDILDTSADYVMAQKKNGSVVVNFEDNGMGAEVADFVFNALYPHKIPQKHILVGPKCFCLRDEFLHIQKRDRKASVKKILLTFGGVDEGNLTCRLLKIISKIIKQFKVEVDVILGPGYLHNDELQKIADDINTKLLRIIRSTNSISEYMNNSDIAITSAGRTVFELASLEIPTIVIAQNLRETTHTFASSEFGFINLGLRSEIDDPSIYRTVLRVYEDNDLRKTMIEKMKPLDLKYGKKRVIEIINKFLR